MADTVRTEEELLQIFADNTKGNISAQDMRDFVVTAMGPPQGDGSALTHLNASSIDSGTLSSQVLPNTPTARVAMGLPTLGDKLRRLAKQSKNNNVWSKPYMKAAPPWQPSTAYAQRQVVVNGGNIYTCVGSSGSSASSGGPTTTNSSISNDSAVNWIYLAANAVTVDPSMTILLWTASTAYTLGQIVQTTAGKMYACVVAGTTSSTPPTGVTNVVTDGSVTWSYYGIYRPNPYSFDFPTVSFSSTLPAGASNIYSLQTDLGKKAIKLRGCYIGPNNLGFSVQAYTFTPAAGATPTGQHCSIEFYTDAPKVSFYIGQGGQVSPVIDGVRYSLTATDLAAGSKNYWSYDFTTTGGRKIRHWRLESQANWAIGHLALDTFSQVWAPDDTDKVTAVCISDSIFQGSAFGPFVTGNNVCQRLGHELGWNDVWSFTMGGTGYVNRGPGAGVTTDIFGTRIAEALTRNPDIWIFAGSVNDIAQPGITADNVTANALACYQAIRNGGSKAPIVVVGVWSKNGAGIPPIETAVQAAITQFNDPLDLTFFIPICFDPNLPWITGSWNNSANTNSANSVLFICSDGTHPPDMGTAYFTQRIADAIRVNVLPYLN